MEICRSVAPYQYTISWYRPLVRSLDDVGILNPHVLATRLINAVHALNQQGRGKGQGKESRGEELRSPDLKRRYTNLCNLNPITRRSPQ